MENMIYKYTSTYEYNHNKRISLGLPKSKKKSEVK
jgi:hypothetical protein